MSSSRNTKIKRTLFNQEHDAVRESFRRFLQKEVVPNFASWEREGIVPREIFEMLGEGGFLCIDVPEEYGGQGLKDFRYNVIFSEECMALGIMPFATGMSLINDIALPYFLELTTEEQKRRWLPDMCRGKLITAIAMTEPSGGSDLAALKTTAVKNGDHYLVNGSKTFITNGINADLVLTAVRTDQGSRSSGISLLVIERDMEGFKRGRNLEKIGNHSQDTAELFFQDVKVPVNNLVGTENHGFIHMMMNLPQERLAIAASGVAHAQAALDWTIEYVKERQAFGRPIGSFQYLRICIAELRTEVEFAQVFIDRCISLLNAGELTAEQAAMAKWKCTELQNRVIDRCLQFHGGYGYMVEFPIARAWMDARISSIYGGTNEIMKEIIGKGEGLN